MNSLLRALLTALALVVAFCLAAAWMGLGMTLILTASDGSVLAGWGAAGWFFVMLVGMLWMFQN